MKLTSIKGYPGLKKDVENGGVVNVDDNAYSNYQTKKKLALMKRNEQARVKSSVDSLQQDINTLKGEMSEIKSILAQLAEKL